ncbi:peptidase M23 [Streptomyces sp. NPDC093586]|uniref:peptidase M23 n=1 Tax=Streptomyces sp. NPDC093586 TaxID=3366042 RepID=UPI00380DD4BD
MEDTHMKRLLRRSVTVLAATAFTAGAVVATAGAAPTTASGGDPALTDVYIWATDVRLRQRPTTDSGVLAVRSRYWVDAVCQKQSQYVHDPAVGGNSWWTAVQELSGSDIAWVNNLYLRGGEKIAGVPDC